MSKNMVNIDDILEDINNIESDKAVDAATDAHGQVLEDFRHKSDSENSETIQPSFSEDSSCWEHFLSLSNSPEVSEERLVIKLDRDIAETLDDCDINGQSRTQLANNIVRAFVNTYLERLAQYKKKKKSLFQDK